MSAVAGGVEPAGALGGTSLSQERLCIAERHDDGRIEDRKRFGNRPDDRKRIAVERDGRADVHLPAARKIRTDQRDAPLRRREIAPAIHGEGGARNRARPVRKSEDERRGPEARVFREARRIGYDDLGHDAADARRAARDLDVAPHARLCARAIKFAAIAEGEDGAGIERGRARNDRLQAFGERSDDDEGENADRDPRDGERRAGEAAAQITKDGEDHAIPGGRRGCKPDCSVAVGSVAL